MAGEGSGCGSTSSTATLTKNKGHSFKFAMHFFFRVLCLSSYSLLEGFTYLTLSFFIFL
jgi:hypothetical protein